MNIVILPPLYLPPSSYFTAMKQADLAVIDTALRYDKRFKSVHRTVITSSDGSAFLTVPVSVPAGRNITWNDVRVSPHGEWWRVQKLTLATLFGATPFYSLIHQDITTLISEKFVGKPITDLDISIIVELRRLLDITTPISVTLDSRLAAMSDVEIIDMRHHDFYQDMDARSVIETLFKTGKQ
ncbi:MAG: WbqC family protein [Muribaculaceae bacterium]|nr:WbqC family protein [Muribaculaceae bacterium]